MKTLWRVVGLTILLCAGHAEAQLNEHSTNYVQDCARALATDSVDYRDNYALRLAYLNTVTRETFEESKKNGGFTAMMGDLPANFTWDDVEKYRQKLRTKLKVDLDVQHSVGLLTYTLSAVGAKAFTDCVNNVFNARGVRLEILQVDATHAQAKVHWVAPNGISEAKLSVIVVGGWPKESPAEIGTVWKANGTSFVNIVRFPGQDLLISAAMRNDAGPIDADGFTIPPFVRLERATRRESVAPANGAVSACSCGGNGHGENVACNAVQVNTSADNQRILLDTAQWTAWAQGGESKPPMDRYVWEVRTDNTVKGHVICSPPSKDATSWVGATIKVDMETTYYEAK